MLFELRVSREENPVAPCRDSHLLRGVVHLTIVIIFVCRVKAKLTLLELVQDHIIRPNFEELVLTLEPGVIFLVDKLPNFVVWKIYPEIEIAKEAFVVMVALFLSVVDRKVVEGVVVDLSHVLYPLIDCVLSTL